MDAMAIKIEVVKTKFVKIESINNRGYQKGGYDSLGGKRGLI